MKKNLFGMVSAGILALGMMSPAAAWTRIATGTSGFGGFNATQMSGGLNGTLATSNGTNTTTTNTTPLSALSTASLAQQTGGLGAATGMLQGELLQQGHTDATAGVNLLSSGTKTGGTTTNGTGAILGAAIGDVSLTVGGLGATSQENSMAFDAPLVGGAGASAMQSVQGGMISGAASGGFGANLASTEISGASTSTTTATQ